MGLLFSRIAQLVWRKEQYKIVIVGLDNAGKSTILYKLLLNQVIATTPTIGSNVEEIKYKNIHFIMWDIGGQESLRSTWTTYFVDTKAIILVIDSTDKERLPIATQELEKIVNHETAKNSILLVLANKQDVKSALGPANISNQLNLTSLKDIQWHIQGCCALTGEGIYEGLDWIVSKLTQK